MSIHMIVSPPLESGTFVISMMAFDLDQFVQDSTGQSQVFIA